MLLSIAFVVALISVGWWVAYQKTAPASGDLSEMPKSVHANTQKPTGTPGQSEGAHALDPVGNSSESELAYTHLTLTEAKAALRKLVELELPPSTGLVKPGHYVMNPSDAANFSQQLQAKVKLEYADQSKWIEFNCGRTKVAGEPDWGVKLKMPADTFFLNMVPAWHGATIPRYSLWVDSNSGVCLFSMSSNYDP